jgi:hypothetical protein
MITCMFFLNIVFLTPYLKILPKLRTFFRLEE